jgi:hypothetical protein
VAEVLLSPPRSLAPLLIDKFRVEAHEHAQPGDNSFRERMNVLRILMTTILCSRHNIESPLEINTNIMRDTMGRAEPQRVPRH